MYNHPQDLRFEPDATLTGKSEASHHAVPELCYFAQQSRSAGMGPS